MTTATTTDWRERHAHDLMASYAPPLRLLVRGEGCWVWDDDGTRYLDFLGGIAVNSLGHAHPVVVEAAGRQAALMVHVSNYFATPSQLELAERLKRITGAGDEGRVYFGNSGAEANEAAFKLARRTGRPRILALKNAFHGRTMGALALTGKPALQEPFLPMVPGVEHLDSTVDALEAAMGDDVAALIVEPIKGETGVVPQPEGFQHEGITPDAVTIAKGIAGGVPLSAMVTFGAASGLLQRGDHGSTFGGNPLATAVANAVLGEIERGDLMGNADRRGREIRAVVEGFGSSLVTEVRGRGLLIGIGTVEGAAPAIAEAALDAGLILNAINSTAIRIAPPLIVGDAEVAAFADKLGAALAAS
jgi:acetylornithine/N-succinyldiaminopimelate aminotransferase